MPARCEFKINREVVKDWFETEKEWRDFLHECFSADDLNACHKCTRKFKGMFGTSAKNSDYFLTFFCHVCNRCKEFIFNYCKPKIIRLRSLNGEFSCRLVQKFYNGILDDKSKNKRKIHTTPDRKTPEVESSTLKSSKNKNSSSKSSKKTDTETTLKTPMRTVNKSKKFKVQLLPDNFDHSAVPRYPRRNLSKTPVKKLKKSQIN